MNILVTGADGQLGRSLRRLVPADTLNTYIFTDIDTLDITSPDAVRHYVDAHAIGMIVNCAAYTNVDRAENDYDCAELLNATAVGYLADAMHRVDGTLIHVSTDYVFGGRPANTPIPENVEPEPTGVYGLTKLHGERAIAASGVKALIFRTAWLYSEYGKNFVKTMLGLMHGRKELKVVIDQVGTPTYAGDLAAAIIEVIERNRYEGNEGIYHYSGQGVCSWYDFAVAIRDIAGLQNCEVRPCRSDEFPSPVARPAYSVLDKTKAEQRLGLTIPHWLTSLAPVVKSLGS